jgi:hypothetical protein
MGTFHQDKSELHGITVVVDTNSDAVYVGRCDDMDDHQVILLDADVHRSEESDQSKEDWVRRAAEFGVWKKFDRLVIPRSDVVSVRRLGDL